MREDVLASLYTAANWRKTGQQSQRPCASVPLLATVVAALVGLLLLTRPPN
jgi:hypothetical protein